GRDALPADAADGALPARLALQDASAQALAFRGLGQQAVELCGGSPRRKERGQPRLIGRVRILVRRDVVSACSGGAQFTQEVLGPAPDELRLEFQVADVGGNAGAAADLDRLVDRAPEELTLRSDVARIDRVRVGERSREL